MLIQTLTKGRKPVRDACYPIRILNIFSDYPEIMKFKVSPDLYESIEIWVHEFTEWILLILIMKYTGWTIEKMDKGFHAYSSGEYVTEEQTIQHIISSLHTISVIKNNLNNQLFVVNCDEYYDIIEENNNLNKAKLTDWLVKNIG